MTSLQTAEQNELLDNAIEEFLRLVAPRLNLRPSIKALEWLVRRFHIHVHNAQSLLLTVLPYYSMPVFLRILDTIPTPLPPIFNFLSNSKKTVKLPSKNLLVRAFAADAELQKLCSSYIVDCVKRGREYQLQLTFWSSFSIWVMTLMKDKRVAEEDIVDRFISDISDILPLQDHPDAQISGYMILSVLSSITRLSNAVINASISSLVFNWDNRALKCGIACVSHLLDGIDGNDIEDIESNEKLDGYDARKISPVFEDSVWEHLNNLKFADRLEQSGNSYNITKFALFYVNSIFRYGSWNLLPYIPSLLDRCTPTQAQLQCLFQNIIYSLKHSQVPMKDIPTIRNFFTNFFSTEKTSNLVKAAMSFQGVSMDSLELILQSTFSEAVEVPTKADKANNSRVSDDGNVQSIINSLKSIDISSFLDAYFDQPQEMYSVFATRSSIFTIALDRFSSSDDLKSILKLDSKQQISFLARIWTGSLPTLVRARSLKLVKKLISGTSVDYQGLVPLLLTCLYDESESVRRLSLEVLFEIQKINGSLKGSFSVWGLDDIFGDDDKSSEVRWMSVDTVTSFITDIILPNAEEIKLNATKIFPLLSNLFNNSTKSLKEISTELLSSLISQAINCKIPSTKTKLLKLVNVSSKSKSKFFALLLKSWFTERDQYAALCKLSNFDIDALETEIFNILSPQEKSTGIAFFENAIKSGIPSVGEKATQKLIELWPTFKQEYQLQLLKFLIDSSLDDNMAFFDASDIFSTLDIDCSIFELLLNELTLETSTSSSISNNKPNSPLPIPKRRRRSSGAAKQRLQTGEMAQVAERHLRKTTLALEILEKNSQLKGSPRLLAQLFTILSEILSLGADSNLPVDYTEQVLANCMIYIVNDLKKQPNANLDSNSMRIDVLVSCIRSSNSQQVQNKFLLLVANLAPLASTTVLHSVMPIFTFMGANTIRQDDEFSAYVIQQTITQVIPALLSKDNQDQDEEIDFLFLSFSAAFSHIPRHRRVRLYSTLVEALGIDTLYRLVFLLGEKYHEAKLRRKSSEAVGIWKFTEHFIRGFSTRDQVNMIKLFLEFLDLIPLTKLTPNDKERSEIPFFKRQIFHSISSLQTDELLGLRAHLLEFLSLIISNEEVVPEFEPLRFSIGKIFDNSQFVEEQEVIKKSFSQAISQLLSSMLALSNSNITREEAPKIRVASKAYYHLLDSILELLPIELFVDTFKGILFESNDKKIQRNSLALIRSKFDLEVYHKDDEFGILAARDAFDTITQFVDDMELSEIENYKELIQMSFEALEHIISKYWEVFDPSKLLSLLDIAVGLKGLLNPEIDILVASIGVINSICSAIGARTIGHFGKIIPVLFGKFEQSVLADTNSSEESQMIQIATFTLVANLVQKLPSFMTSSLAKILRLLFISTIDVDTIMRLLKSLAEHVDIKKLVNAYIDTWQVAVTNNWDSVNLFLVSLNEIVNSVERKTVSSLASRLLGFLLKAFEVRSLGSKYDNNTYNRIEMAVSKTGLIIVMKLNDKTFRPLFVRMVRWAINGEEGDPNFDTIQRQAIFFKFTTNLFANLKSIVTSYYGYLVDSTCDILDVMADPKKKENLVEKHKAAMPLRSAILNTLAVCFQYDREEFWQSSARFDRISESLLKQYKTIDVNQGKILVKAVVALAKVVPSADQHKVINDGILVHLKDSCKVNEKIWAIRTLKALYSKLGEEWVPMLNPLVPIITELLQDNDEIVQKEVNKSLAPVIEDVLGEKLDKYLS